MPTKKTRNSRSARGSFGVSVQYAVARRGLPGAVSLRRWTRAANATMDVTLRIVASQEGKNLNKKFRGKNYPTNVLSFPYDRSRGDIVLCHPVIAREARAQGKTLAAHYAHLVVHGILHLCGHDHMNKKEALWMERAERRILRRLGLPDPYG